MRIRELIAELQACNPEAEIRWYHLEDHIMTGMELETIIKHAWDERPTVEITVKPEGSEYGGVQCFEAENVGTDYFYLEGHEPHCNVMGSCCCGCLKLNGFWIDDGLPPVTLEDVIEANKRMAWKPQPFN